LHTEGNATKWAKKGGKAVKALYEEHMAWGKPFPIGQSYDNYIQYCQGWIAKIQAGASSVPQRVQQMAIHSWMKLMGQAMERRDKRELASRPITIVQIPMKKPNGGENEPK
jgi:hypothetical protein